MPSQKTPQAPEIFQLPLDRIDLPGLPPHTDPGFSDAVIAQYALQYAAKGWNAAVTVSDGMVRVLAVPQQGIEPIKYLTGLCQHGFIEDALPGLEALNGMVDDADVAYNLGVALSETGKIEESLAPLNKCLNIDPGYDNAAIAIGVSLSKLKRYEEAEIVIKSATKLQPDNPLIKQNLAATLASAGKFLEALPYFRQAISLAPGNPAVLMGLAQCLDSVDEGDHRKESLSVYREVIRKFPDTQFAEAAKAILNRSGQEKLHAVSGGNVRLDAVEYMVAALNRFAAMPKEQVGRITMEIAQLGQNGLSFDPNVRYKLENLEMDGGMSGLQCVCYMHVGLKQFDPRANSGSGLDREYEMAKGMAGK